MSQPMSRERKAGVMAIPTDNDGNSLLGLEENNTPIEKMAVTVDEFSAINIRMKGKGKQITMYNQQKELSRKSLQSDQPITVVGTGKSCVKNPDVRSTRKRSHENKKKPCLDQSETPSISHTVTTVPDFISQSDMKTTVQPGEQKSIPLKKRRRPDSPFKRHEKIREIRKTSRNSQETKVLFEEIQIEKSPSNKDDLALKLLTFWTKSGVTIEGKRYRVWLEPETENESPTIDSSYLEQHGFSPGQTSPDFGGQDLLQKSSLLGIPEVTEEFSEALYPAVLEHTTPLDLTWRPQDSRSKMAPETVTKQTRVDPDDQYEYQHMTGVTQSEAFAEGQFTKHVDIDVIDVELIEESCEIELIEESCEMTAENSLPGLEHATQNLPSLEHAAQNLPSLEHAAQNLPSLEHAAQNLPSLEHGAQNLSLDSRPNSQPGSDSILPLEVVMEEASPNTTILQTNQLSVNQWLWLLHKLQQNQASTSLDGAMKYENKASLSSAEPQASTSGENVEQVEATGLDRSQVQAVSMLTSLGITKEDGSPTVTLSELVKDKLSSKLKKPK